MKFNLPLCIIDERGIIHTNCIVHSYGNTEKKYNRVIFGSIGIINSVYGISIKKLCQN